MGEEVRSYRIRTTIGEDSYLSVNLEQEYDSFDILSVKINSNDVYRLHNSNYGVVVGRVLANNGFGIPNAKISIFIESDDTDGVEMRSIYPFKTTSSKDGNGVRYNLLPDEKVGDCHQVVGTFPNKRYVLDNEDIIEVFDKYYKYTTRTNNAGDYMIVGVPTGNYTLHMDLDLSDCGILSQRPRDFVYMGYTIEQFENPNMFRAGTNYSSLSQIFTQDQNVYVQPFWGNESLGDTIGITRADIDVAFKFEPTCVFMGCVASDNSSQGISKKCIPTPHMGDMDELTTGEGTIEMIRKTYAGSVEEFQVKGTELINGDGIWCYQIPMNLDYMITDEYGNMVPTDNPDKGIPTRARVRFRFSMQDMEKNFDNYFRPKILVPHNPASLNGNGYEDYDYEFGTNTKDSSFRDLFWNNVYTVKSYIPRFQKRKVGGWKEDKFTGIKHVQDFGKNNPMPYNNIRIKLPFMFKVMCIIIKIFIKVTAVINTLISSVGNMMADIGSMKLLRAVKGIRELYRRALDLKMNVIDEGMCPDLENWYFSPMFRNNLWTPYRKTPKGEARYDLLKQTLRSINADDDPQSIDDQNQDSEDEATCLTIRTDYLLSCIEMNLAQEYKVINFDFYNDWINGMLYFPRFMRYIRKKRRFLGITLAKEKVKGCMDDTKVFSRSRRYTQLCSVGFKKTTETNADTYSKVTTNLNNKIQRIKANNLHKRRGLTQQKIFGKNGGICHEKQTMYGQYVYYMKPCEWTRKTSPANRKVTLFATDIVLLGSLNDCDLYGIPQAFKYLSSSSYIMPTNLALTNMETNGPLYAYGDNGTICSKTNQTTENTNVDDIAKPVRVVPQGGNALANELKFYSGASSNYDVEYDDPSDTIALTEAAGISWNYTGPGQGNIDEKKLYYPGGHFLGLTCVNSQTNIKSCINLERICEVGSTMSQRREDVREVSGGRLKYVYSVPTGLISGDDIIDPDFRVMFSTMNKNRLIATKRNEENGYLMYDFSYMHPVNFNGELSKYTGGEPYNKRISINEESNALKLYGIEEGNGRDDYDAEETANTQTRTLEFTSKDYYMFRLGLEYNELKANNSRHIRHFAYDKNGEVYLPQYENSFYFYFGMKDGSTALDEFNRQFFSECESSTLNQREPSSYMIVSDYEPCNGGSLVSPYLENLEGTVKCTIVGDIINASYDGWEISDDKKTLTGVFEDGEIPSVFLHQGTYKFSAIDSEGTEVTANFTIGEGAVEGVFTAHDFNILMPGNVIRRFPSNENMFYGGYLAASDIVIDGYEGEVVLEAFDAGVDPYTTTPAHTARTSSMAAELYVSKSNHDYDIYVRYKCPNGTDEDGNVIQYGVQHIFVASMNLMDTDDTYLTIGAVEKYEETGSAFRNNWWTDSSVTGATERAWNIRKSITKETEDGTEITFATSIQAVNGLKAIWGTPQSSTGIPESNKLSASEYEDSIGSGTLDDEAVYFSTYSTPTYENVRQYNAAAYNGVVVGGVFFATVTNQTGLTKTITPTDSATKRYYDETIPRGCFFKPLPDGDLIPAKYVQDNTIEVFCTAQEAREYSTGIVYPAIIYPVIDKPFKVDVNYFEIMNRFVDVVANEEGNGVKAAVNRVNSGKCEATIINGLTYDGYYCGNSYISYGTDEHPILGKMDQDGCTELRAITVNDYRGISQTVPINVKTEFSENFYEETDNPSYAIIEGSPMYEDANYFYAYSAAGRTAREKYFEYESVSEQRALSMNTEFFDSIYYNAIGDNPENGYLFFGRGTSDANVKYYAVNINSLMNQDGKRIIEIKTGTTAKDYITEPREKRWIWGDNIKDLYIVATYTDKAIYDTEGTETLVKIRDTDWNGIYAFVKWTEEDATDDGESRMVEHKIKVGSGNFDYNTNLSDFLNKAIRDSGGRIEFPNRREVIGTYFGKSDKKSWTNAVINKLSQFKEVNVPEESSAYNNIYENTTYDDDGTIGPGKFVIIGVAQYQEDYGHSTGSVCRVYLYPTKVKKEESGTLNVIVERNDNLNSIGSGATNISLSVKCYGTYSYSIGSSDPTWLSITGENVGSGSLADGQETTRTITVNVSENNGYADRTGHIVVNHGIANSNESSYMIAVTQAAGHHEDYVPPATTP